MAMILPLNSNVYFFGQKATFTFQFFEKVSKIEFYSFYGPILSSRLIFFEWS